MKLTPIVATAFAAITTLSADAALITWGAATTISGDTDVSTNGTLVDAFTFGTVSVPSTTVNGVTFAAFAVPGSPSVTLGNYTLASSAFVGSASNFGSPATPFSSLSAPYQSLLSQAAGTLAGNTFTLTLGGLTVGTAYEFQWWANNSDVITNPTTATAGNSVSLDPNVGNFSGSVGQFAIGTFVADSVSQQITFSGSGSGLFGQPSVTGFQLRDVTPAPAAVPEPGTALAGLVLAGLCGTMRRRRAV